MVSQENWLQLLVGWDQAKTHFLLMEPSPFTAAVMRVDVIAHLEKAVLKCCTALRTR